MFHHIQLLSFISSYGYLAIFIGSFIEGEGVVFLGGLLAYQKVLSFSMVIIFAFIGTIMADLFWFLMGRYYGSRLIKRFEWLKKKTEIYLSYVEKKSKILSFSMRFFYGLKCIIPFSLGITKISIKTFIRLNMVGAVLWVFLVTIIGYLFGGVIESIFGRLRYYQVMFVIITILVFVLLNYIFKLLGYIIKRVSDIAKI